MFERGLAFGGFKITLPFLRADFGIMRLVVNQLKRSSKFCAYIFPLAVFLKPPFDIRAEADVKLFVFEAEENVDVVHFHWKMVVYRSLRSGTRR